MCTTNKPIKNIDTLVLQLTAGQSTYNLPNDQILDQAVKINALLAIYDDTGDRVGPNGQTLLPAVNFNSAYISFSDKNNKILYQQMPLQSFALATAQGYPQPILDLDLKDIVTTKCQVFIGNTTGITSDMVLLLTFSYEY